MKVQTRTPVTRIFHDKDLVVEAVEALASHGVPVGQIDVTLVDGSGQYGRRIPVRREYGLLRGTAVGGAVGALLVAAVFTLTALGVLGSDGAALFSSDVLSAAIRGFAVGGFAGIPIGALLGLARWRGRVTLGSDGVADGGVIIRVRDRGEVADTARQVLDEVGANGNTA